MDSLHSLTAFKRERAKNNQGFVNITPRTMVRQEEAENYNDLARTQFKILYIKASQNIDDDI